MAVHGNTECVIPPAALTGNHELQIRSSLYLCNKVSYVAPSASNCDPLSQHPACLDYRCEPPCLGSP